VRPATIGPFKIERELGRGGRWGIFARETQLGRRVAIATLPAHQAVDLYRLTSFQPEAA
jgi:hypothetical protein